MRNVSYKHFLEEKEFVTKWSKLTKFTFEDISQTRSYLSQIGCPAAFNTGMACYKCTVFDQCTYIISELEKEYANIIKLIVNNSVETPLFSIFDSKKTDGKFLICLNRYSIVAKAAATQGEKYNLATCYASNLNYESFIEFRDKTIRKIRNEATKGTAVWCSTMTWGLGREKSGSSFKTSSKQKPKNKKISHQPYRRGGSVNYRQYLDDNDFD